MEVIREMYRQEQRRNFAVSTIFQIENRYYLPQYCQDKGFQDTVINQAC